MAPTGPFRPVYYDTGAALFSKQKVKMENELKRGQDGIITCFLSDNKISEGVQT